jgi:hypothetical protein
MKRKLKIKPIYECRCDGRLQTKRFTRLSHTGLVVELEHLKIKTRLINEVNLLKTTNSEIYEPLTHWVGRGTGTPKDKDEVNKREVCECEG